MTKIKICGLREPAHAVAAAEAGADLLGMVFAPARRQISLDQAIAIADAVRRAGPNPPRLVGVFVNAPVQEVRDTIARVGLDLAQLSGDEDEDYLEELRVPFIRAVHVGATAPGRVAWITLRRRLAGLRNLGGLPLLDARVEGHYGGTGQTFDWSDAEGLAAEYDFLLAGGLTPENAAGAIGRVRPWGVDVSSGVEIGGVKDPTLIRTFIQAVHRAGGT